MNNPFHLDWPTLHLENLSWIWRNNGVWFVLLGIFSLISSPFFIEKYIVSTLQKELQRSAINFAENLEKQMEVEKSGFYRAVWAEPDPQLDFDEIARGWINNTADVLAVHLLDQNGQVLKSSEKSSLKTAVGKEFIADWETRNRIAIAHALELREPTFSALYQLQDESLVNLILPTEGTKPLVYVVTLDAKQWLVNKGGDNDHSMRIDILPFRADIKEDYNRHYINSAAWEGKWSLRFQSKDPLFALIQILRPVFFTLTWLITGLFFLYWRNFRLRQKAELELQSKSQLLEKQSRLSLLGEMSAQLAHEINQPLTSIANYAVAGKLQLQHAGSNASLAPLFQDILDQSQRAAQVLVTVRAILQPIPMELSSIDVNDLIKKLEPSLRFLCAPHGVTLHVSCLTAMPVKLNAILFEQVIFNLVKNSVQSLADSDRPDKRITISSALVDGHVFIEHADNGLGIQAPHVGKIFESFFTTKAEGLGIGLSLCRSVIERFNGRLTLKSNSTQGACFLIDIPAVPTLSEIRAS